MTSQLYFRNPLPPKLIRIKNIAVENDWTLEQKIKTKPLAANNNDSKSDPNLPPRTHACNHFSIEAFEKKWKSSLICQIQVDLITNQTRSDGAAMAFMHL